MPYPSQPCIEQAKKLKESSKVWGRSSDIDSYACTRVPAGTVSISTSPGVSIPGPELEVWSPAQGFWDVMCFWQDIWFLIGILIKKGLRSSPFFVKIAIKHYMLC